jgi:hypothetical protein
MKRNTMSLPFLEKKNATLSISGNIPPMFEIHNEGDPAKPISELFLFCSTFLVYQIA